MRGKRNEEFERRCREDGERYRAEQARMPEPITLLQLSGIEREAARGVVETAKAAVVVEHEKHTGCQSYGSGPNSAWLVDDIVRAINQVRLNKAHQSLPTERFIDD